MNLKETFIENFQVSPLTGISFGFPSTLESLITWLLCDFPLVVFFITEFCKMSPPDDDDCPLLWLNVGILGILAGSWLSSFSGSCNPFNSSAKSSIPYCCAIRSPSSNNVSFISLDLVSWLNCVGSICARKCWIKSSPSAELSPHGDEPPLCKSDPENKKIFSYLLHIYYNVLLLVYNFYIDCMLQCKF